MISHFSNRKNAWQTGILVLVFAAFVLNAVPLRVFAQEPDVAPQPLPKTGESAADRIPCGSTGFVDAIVNLASGACILKGIAWFLYGVLVSISTLLGWAATLVDKVIAITLDPARYDSPALRIGWQFSRDVANLFFIFILLSISIGTILQVEAYGIKRVLSRLIIVALIINFSFVIPQYIILTSNSIAQIFLKSASTNGTLGLSGTFSMLVAQNLNPQKFFSTADIGLQGKKDQLKEVEAQLAGCASAETASGVIDENTGITTTVCSQSVTLDSARRISLQNSQKSLTTQIANAESGWTDRIQIAAGAVATEVFGIIFITAAFFLFVAVALMLLNRTVQVWILMILSPFAFLFSILGRTNAYANKWWEKLIQQSVFPIVFLFFFNISMRIVAGLNVAPDPLNQLAVSGNAIFNINDLITYIVTYALLIASLTMAHAAGGKGGEIAMKAYGRVGKTARGVLSYTGRKTGGAALGYAGRGARAAMAPLAKMATGESVRDKKTGEVTKQAPLLSRVLRTQGIRQLGGGLLQQQAERVLAARRGIITDDKKYEKYSAKALKDAAKAALDPLETAKIFNQLVKKKNLRTDEDRGFTSEFIKNGLKLLKDYGVDTKDADALKIQYATDEEKKNPVEVKKMFQQTSAKVVQDTLMEGGEAASAMADALKALGKVFKTVEGAASEISKQDENGKPGNIALAKWMTKGPGRTLIESYVEEGNEENKKEKPEETENKYKVGFDV